MWLVRRGCQEIMELHRARQTESFYEKMLACYLYERGVPYMTQARLGFSCGRGSIKDFYRISSIMTAVDKLGKALGNLSDIMEVVVKDGLGNPMRRLLPVYFSVPIIPGWKGLHFYSYLMFDDSELFDRLYGKEKVEEEILHVVDVKEWFQTLLFTVNLGGNFYLMKCFPKRMSSFYESLRNKKKFYSVMEKEVEGLKAANSIDKVADECVRLYAHGQLTAVDHRGFRVHDFEVIIMHRGSGQSLLDFIKLKPNDDVIKKLTVRCFSMLQNLHAAGIAHGDVKPDQFIWAYDRDVGSEKLIWIDFARFIRRDGLSKRLWNLRRLMDLNYLLLCNPLSVQRGYCIPENPVCDYRLDCIRKAMTSPILKNLILPNSIMASVGGLEVTDERSFDAYTRFFYQDEDISFLDTIDIDAFFDAMPGENSLFDLIHIIGKKSLEFGMRKPAREDYVPVEWLLPTMPAPSHPAPQPAQHSAPQPPPHSVPQPVPHSAPRVHLPPIPPTAPRVHLPPIPPTAPSHSPSPPPAAPLHVVPQAVPPPVQQRTVAIPLIFHGHQLYSPDGLPYQYFMVGHAIILYDGRNQVFLDVIKCLTIINGGLVQLHSPEHNNAPLFFFLHPGMMDLLIFDGRGYRKVMQQQLQ